MASEQDGLQEQKEILVKKLTHFRKKLAITSDAAQEFNLQMQIEETEKEIVEIDAKIAIINASNQVAVPSTSNSKETKMSEKTLHDTTVNKLKNNKIVVVVLIIFAVITGFATLLTSIDDIKKAFGFDSKKVIPTDTNKIIIDTPVIIKPAEIFKPNTPKPLPPTEKQPSSKKYIFIKLILDITYEKATIFANNVQVYPVNDAPTVKELSLEYNGNPVELRIVTTGKTCTHYITVSEDYFKNPQTIEKICSQ